MTTAHAQTTTPSRATAGVSNGPSRPGLLGAAWIIWKKDLRLEWRTRARANALAFFSLATLLVFSFALGPDTALLAQNAGGYLWLALLFASVLALGESFRVEQENRALETLLLTPIDARSVFLGKAAANAFFLWALSMVLVPVMIALYGVTLRDSLAYPKLCGVLLLGTLAISAPGTLLSALAGLVRAKDVLLPLLLFPLLVPALLSCVKATQLVVNGDPMGDASAWFALLGIFNVVYWALGFVLFPVIVDE